MRTYNPIKEDTLKDIRMDIMFEYGPQEFEEACGIVATFLSITRIVDCSGHKSNTIKYAARFSNFLVTTRKIFEYIFPIITFL